MHERLPLLQKENPMFRNWWRQTDRPRPAQSARNRFRPSLEALEERAVPSTFYVVPTNQATDASHVTSLQAAYNCLHSPGDVIQIEPNSTPGGFDDTQHAFGWSGEVAVQGDPNVPLAALPQLDNIAVGYSMWGHHNAGFEFKHINLSSVSALSTPILMLGDGISQSVVLTKGFGNIENCQFHNSSSSTAGMLQLLQADGTLVEGNSFTSSVNGDLAILVRGSQQVVVQSNQIALTSGDNFDTGIFVMTGGRPTSVSLNSNTIATSPSAGMGIDTFKDSYQNLAVTIQGNDLRQNLAGLVAFGDGYVLGSIDAGSPGGSAGGNNFQGFMPGDGRFAIATFNASMGTLEARSNLWSANPQSVVTTDRGTTIDTAGGLIVTPAIWQFAGQIGPFFAMAAGQGSSADAVQASGTGVSNAHGAYSSAFAAADPVVHPPSLDNDPLPAGSAARAAFFKALASPMRQNTSSNPGPWSDAGAMGAMHSLIGLLDVADGAIIAI
jgi:hypothetical protein